MLTILIYNGYSYYNAKLYLTAVPAERGSRRRVLRRSLLRTAGTAYCGTAAQHWQELAGRTKGLFWS